MLFTEEIVWVASRVSHFICFSPSCISINVPITEESSNAHHRDTPTFMFYDDNIYLHIRSILVLPERRHHTVSSIDAVPSAIQRSCPKRLFRRFARCCWCARWTVARIPFMCTEAGVTVKYSETICTATGGDYKSFYSSVRRNVGCQSRATRRFR